MFTNIQILDNSYTNDNPYSTTNIIATNMLIPLLTCLILNLEFSNSNILDAESNYQKPKLERNNIVNKGVWVKSKFDENLFEKTSFGNYFFKPNSLDEVNLLNNFDLFAPNGVEEIPTVTNYVERSKRAPECKFFF